MTTEMQKTKRQIFLRLLEEGMKINEACSIVGLSFSQAICEED